MADLLGLADGSDGPDQVAQAVEPMRSTIESAVHDLRDCRDRRGWEPEPLSPAARDAEADAELAGGLGDRPVSDVRLAALLLCTAAEDHALALTKLLGVHHPVFAHHPLARSVLECAARASNLVEVGLTPRQRLIRWTNDRLYSLAEMKKLSPAGAAQATARTDQLLDAAEELGLDRSAAGRRRPPQLKPPRKDSTQLVGRLMADGDDPTGFGTLSYRLFSATTHGTAYALAQRLEALDRPADRGEPVTGALKITATEVNASLAAVFYGYAILTREILVYMGWEEPDLTRALDNGAAIARGLDLGGEQP